MKPVISAALIFIGIALTQGVVLMLGNAAEISLKGHLLWTWIVGLGLCCLWFGSTCRSYDNGRQDTLLDLMASGMLSAEQCKQLAEELING